MTNICPIRLVSICSYVNHHTSQFAIMNFEIVAGERENNLVIYQNEIFLKQILWNI